ncbi:5'-methylthioadenosine/adenosylhomocysteine nucleosidase [Halosquirtibacter laminarini]|uniref:5'-methylthioadenosine/adenosylhomocysteine nucleosidase n=1 Tax=Halosquirtibacter laminarini TaxID=3374600 RepID=A0AC61NJ15_9BACT|nr:5'-methylthioadenosine/adenosylhomocysteine nucleosidase [Prolixibacteraceae bacterium]
MKNKAVLIFITIILLVTFTIIKLLQNNKKSNCQDIVAIVGAMPIEISEFLSRIENPQTVYIQQIPFVTGYIDKKPIVLLKCGIGKVNSSMSTTLLIDHFNPSKILFTGIAGAMNDTLHPGDIVIGTRYMQHDLGTFVMGKMVNWAVPNIHTDKDLPLYIDADKSLLAKAHNLYDFQERCFFGTIISGDQFISDSNKKRELNETIAPWAVDMESAAIAQVCFQLKTPFLIFRSISDSANDEAEETYTFNKENAAKKSVDMIIKIL